MKQTAFFIVVLTLAAMLAPAQAKAQDQGSIESQIRDLEAHRFRAMTEVDLPSLERLLAADLVYTHASGWRQTRAEFLASLRSGELVYHSIAARNFTARVYGDTVLVTGRASAKVRSKGQELNVELLYLEAYVKQDGRWQLAAWQSTRANQTGAGNPAGRHS
jgi:ketosteroid isomerase-like protein